MCEDLGETERCTGCGAEVEDGTTGCQAIMEEFLARDFSDPTYFSVHRMVVDTYALQHPDRYCVSAKSLAAHLTGLCWLIEHAGSKALGSESLRRWLNGTPRILRTEKPAIPESRGAVTILDVRGAPDAASYAQSVECWARSTWDAYAPLHRLAREWIQQALSRRNSPPRKRIG